MIRYKENGDLGEELQIPFGSDTVDADKLSITGIHF